MSMNRSEALRAVQTRSADLRRELGLKDLALAQILIVVGSGWVGLAAKLGSASVLYWIAGMALFYFPLALTVDHLNRWMPLEGGLYQWAKFAYGESMGFFVGWNFWAFVTIFVSGLGLSVVSGIGYAWAGGPEWAENPWIVAGANLAVALFLVVSALIGLGWGKWLHNLASAALIAVFAALIALPFLVESSLATVEFRLPELSLLNVALFGKMAVYGLAGLECVAILAGECKRPQSAVGKSALLAGPVIGLLYILGTQSVLRFVDPEKVDLIQPISQVFQTALGPAGAAALLVSVVVLLLLARDCSQASLVFSAASRMPLVAGWDRLLPQWFTRLSRGSRTPVNAILTAGLAIFVAASLGQTGVGAQEAFQLLQSAAGVLFAVNYLVMFSIPLWHAWRGAAPVASSVKAASACGLAVTAVFTVLSIVPVIEVEDPFQYGLKIAVAAVAINLLGGAVYWSGRRRAPSAER